MIKTRLVTKEVEEEYPECDVCGEEIKEDEGLTLGSPYKVADFSYHFHKSCLISREQEDQSRHEQEASL